MTDLENLKSTGKKLIYLAWAIEIIVAAVGLTMAWGFITQGSEQAKQASATFTSDTDYLIMGLAFSVVALMELTKIPFSIALYNSAKVNWRVIFFIALFAVNFSTFETIIQGFELAYNERSKIVDIKRKELDLLKAELITKLDIDNEEIKLSDDISKIQSQISKLRNDIIAQNAIISDIKKRKNSDIANLRKSYESASSNSQQITKLIEQKRKDIIRYEGIINKLRQDRVAIKDIKGTFGAPAERKRLRELNDKEQNKYSELINSTNNEISSLQSELSSTISQEKSELNPQISSIENNANEDIKKVNDRINSITNEINAIQSNQLKNVQNIKSEFSKNKELSLKERADKQIEIDNKNKEFNDIASGNQIYRLALSLKLGPSKWLFGEEKVKDGFTYHDLTQADIGRAFWIWFGFLALIISIIGTLVAFAGLHLQDKTIHEKRSKEIRTRRSFFNRLSRYSNLAKFLVRPKTVEKIVEKEIEIEKIVEKPIIEEKIVVQKVEIPKEVEKKVYVHVPLPTDDPELLKKAPFVYEEEKKPKKK